LFGSKIKIGVIMKIKKIGILFAFMLLIMGVAAHPPQKIELKFDIKTQELNAKIDHSVRDINEHFINKISIKINGTEVLSKDYENQKDLKSDVYHFTLENVKAGDEIELTASCNKWGKKSKKLIVK